MTLSLFDLDGFKRYNDTFGHPAGDALLQRLARKLQASVAGRGRAYRMGGDEFCMLLRPAAADAGRLVAGAASALRETIGKMAIPDAILDKPGPLDDEEWAFMRRHTIIGESILSAAPALRPVARIVRCSHERYDGAGYPDRLAGTDIPLGARIVAVCDAYDAMTSDRSYRPAMRPQAALEELRSGAGAQFDPGVVQVFCAVVAEAAAAPVR